MQSMLVITSHYRFKESLKSQEKTNKSWINHLKVRTRLNNLGLNYLKIKGKQVKLSKSGENWWEYSCNVHQCPCNVHQTLSKGWSTGCTIRSWQVGDKYQQLMPHLQAVVRPLTFCLSAKIADLTSRLQDNRTIAARFLLRFHAKNAENNGHAD